MCSLITTNDLPLKNTLVGMPRTNIKHILVQNWRRECCREFSSVVEGLRSLTAFWVCQWIKREKTTIGHETPAQGVVQLLLSLENEAQCVKRCVVPEWLMQHSVAPFQGAFSPPHRLCKSYQGGLEGQFRCASDLPPKVVLKPHQMWASVCANKYDCTAPLFALNHNSNDTQVPLCQ